jgi:polyhydroxyalkanoate synthesis regulator phasin
MKKLIVLAASLAAASALVAGVGSAAAADTPKLGDAVAARLGITGDQLRAAFKAELSARIDAAVAAGKLTPDQGAKLKERIANAKGLGIGIRKAFASRHKALVGRIANPNAKGPAATYLGMTRAELVAALKSGKSLAQIAQSKGKSVDGLVAAIVAPAKARAAKAVANGKLTQQRADELIAKLTERVQKLVQRVPATAS